MASEVANLYNNNYKCIVAMYLNNVAIYIIIRVLFALVICASSVDSIQSGCLIVQGKSCLYIIDC